MRKPLRGWDWPPRRLRGNGSTCRRLLNPAALLEEGAHPRRRRRPRPKLRQPLPFLLALLLLLLGLVVVAEAKRPPPADSISMRIRKPRGSGGGKKGGEGRGPKVGEPASPRAGDRKAKGSTGQSSAPSSAAAASSSAAASPDLLGRLTSSLPTWKPSSLGPARRLGWRKLHITPDYLILESRLSPEVFAIPRTPPSINGSKAAAAARVRVERRPKASFPSLPQSPSSSTLSIDGVFGFFDLPSGGSYLAVITDSEERYRGHGMEFRLITKVTLVRVSNAASAEEGGGTGKAAAAAAARMLGEEDGDDGEEEEDEDAKQLELLRMAFQAHDLFFSTSCDVTLSAQRRATLDGGVGVNGQHPPPRPRLAPLWQRADERFFWNKNLLGPLMEANAHEWVLPVMSAHVACARNVSLHGQGSKEEGSLGTLLLISRRSCLRQGRRFVKRGIDAEGHTANFVETEQVFISQKDGALTSLVQVRGSIPLFWASPANLKYTPKVQIERTLLENTVAMGRHYHDLLARYGSPVVLVNLIDRKKDQGRLGRALETVHHLVVGALATLPPPAPKGGGGFLAGVVGVDKKKKRTEGEVALTWFDFHAECKRMRWDRLSLLLDQLHAPIDAQGYFWADGQGRVRQLQQGVLRTNCMDCLDRTNVVQSIFARASLAKQLQEAHGVEHAGGGTVLQLPFDGVERPFRHLWSGNADAISLLYAGTPALKGDFTRTGKRTRRGALQDGIHSVKRYVINNFVDAWNQKAVEAMLGRGVGGDNAPFVVLPEHGTGLTVEELEVWKGALRDGGGVGLGEGVVVVEVEGDADRLLGELVPEWEEEEEGKGMEGEGEEGDEEDRAVGELYSEEGVHGQGEEEEEEDDDDDEGSYGEDDEDGEEWGGGDGGEDFAEAVANAAQGFM